MKFETTTLREDKYIAPLCTTTDMVSEGVLCSSIDGLDKEINFDPWESDQE